MIKEATRVVGLLACLGMATLAHAGEDACMTDQLSFESTLNKWVNVPAEGGPVQVRRMKGSGNTTCPKVSPWEVPAGMFDDQRQKLIWGDPQGAPTSTVIEYWVNPNPTNAPRVARYTLRLRDVPGDQGTTLEFRQAAGSNLPPPISNDPSLLGAERSCSNVKMSIVKSGATFKADSFVLSPNRQFKLVYQSDGNFVLYDSASKAVWGTQKLGQGGRMAMQSDGNLVSYDAQNRALWSSKTQGKPGAFLAVQDDGNLVIYAKDSCKALWARR